MNSRLFTSLILAGALASATPVFAKGNKGGGGHGGGHAVAAAVHRGRGGGRGFASVHRGGGNFSRHVAVNRAPSVNRNFTVNRGNTRNFTAANTNRFRGGKRNSVALGGGAAVNNNRSFNGGRQYAFASHNGWSHDHEYFWHGHHYRWYDNAWFIIDPYPYYAGYGYYGPAYYGSSGVSVQVQQALAQDGYYNGPVDGIIGPGTRNAIAAYQQDNGLAVTGTITPALLGSLGVNG